MRSYLLFIVSSCGNERISFLPSCSAPLAAITPLSFPFIVLGGIKSFSCALALFVGRQLMHISIHACCLEVDALFHWLHVVRPNAFHVHSRSFSRCCWGEGASTQMLVHTTSSEGNVVLFPRVFRAGGQHIFTMSLYGRPLVFEIQ